MPRKGAAKQKPRVSRVKKAAKAGVPAAFFVAPTTPFVPVRQRAAAFSIANAPGVPSPHLVDLRSVTVKRPRGAKAYAGRKESAGFASVNIPRTISQRPDANRVWDQFALVAFGRFLFSIAKAVVIGAGSLVIMPLAAGLKLVDRFDSDRPTPIESKENLETEPFKAVQLENPAAAAPAHNPQLVTRKLNLRRALVSFAGTSLAIILPLQGFNALRMIENLKDQAAVAQAVSLEALNGNATLSDAQAAIMQTKQTVDDLGQIGNALLERVPNVGGVFRSGKALLDAGAELATAAALLSRSMDIMNDPLLSVTDKISRAENLAIQAEPSLRLAQNLLEQADSLPDGISGNIVSLKDKVADLENITSGFINIAPSLREILGEKQARRYLVIFQNNAELRPTGGFIGSFAIVDVDRGEIKAVDVPAGGSYDLQGSLKASVLAPEPLRLVRAKWEFQDANWFPDFETSAKKLTWFYNQSNGPTVDGVIALNAPVLANLLDAVGPINMPAYGTVATSTTVLQTAQEIVESTAARESGKPKQFIADLLPLVLEKIMNAGGDQALRTASIFAKALEVKDIQLQFSHPDAEKAFAALGWTGQLAQIPEGFDSLELVRANIAGSKTDAVMKTGIRHEAVITSDGRITDHVTVSLAHNGKKGDRFTGVRNVTYLRLYVPEGSRLIKAGGDIRPPAYSFFDLPSEGVSPDLTVADVTGPVLHDPNTGTAVNNEFDRTVFGVWTQTDPGAISTVTFDYELPFLVTPMSPAPTLREKIGLATAPAATAVFGLVIERQSGADRTEINSTLKLPHGWYLSLASPEGIAGVDGWSYTTEINANKVIGAIISR